MRFGLAVQERVGVQMKGFLVDGWMMPNAALLLLSRSTLFLFPFLRIVLGSLVLFSIPEIISHISSASLWFSGLIAEPLLLTRMSLGSGVRSCLAAHRTVPGAPP